MMIVMIVNSDVHRYRCCVLRKWTEQWSAVEQQRAAARAEPMALPMRLGCRRVFGGVELGIQGLVSRGL